MQSPGAKRKDIRIGLGRVEEETINNIFCYHFLTQLTLLSYAYFLSDNVFSSIPLTMTMTVIVLSAELLQKVKLTMPLLNFISQPLLLTKTSM